MALKNIQKTRLKQMGFALLLMILSNTLLSTYQVPSPPPIEAFLSKSQLLQYTLLQIVFIVSFLSSAFFCGMAVQARD